MQSTSTRPISYSTGNTKGATAPPPTLTLPSVTSASGYVFPPIYSFPAFFTRQPKVSTFDSQSRQWQALILSYCRYHRVFRIDLAESALLRSDDTPTGELWENKRIQRRLKPEFILELVHILVKAGSAAYDPPIATSRLGSSSSVAPQLPSGTGALILWRSIEEWGQIIYHWVVESGQTNSIMTFFELQEPSSTKDFADLPLPLLKLALQTLIKQNKAQVFQVADGEGVKFF